MSKICLSNSPPTEIKISVVNIEICDYTMADMTVFMNLGGDIPNQFEDDGIYINLNLIPESGRIDKSGMGVIQLKFEEAYALYKAIGFFLDEYKALTKQPKQS